MFAKLEEIERSFMDLGAGARGSCKFIIIRKDIRK